MRFSIPVLSALTLASAALLSGANTDKTAAVPTFNKDIAPILYQNCSNCHRPGEVAPFALLTYEQTRKRAADIVRLTGDRKMPPWPASTTEGGRSATRG